MKVLITGGCGFIGSNFGKWGGRSLELLRDFRNENYDEKFILVKEQIWLSMFFF